MPTELTYAMVTPYSLLKSRTGGIIGRLLSLSNLEFVGARLYAPTDGFVDQYVATIADQRMEARFKTALMGYVNDNLRRNNRLGISNRVTVLLFEGEDATKRLRDVIGPISDHLKGDTVRGTYGDFVCGASGDVEYFEPAVLSAADPGMSKKQLALLAEYAESDGGVLERVVKFPAGAKPETTLVILKPDSLRRGSSRPGNIIDMFSRTGLYIVAAKLLRMSVAQAEEFYRPVREMFVDKLRDRVAAKIAAALQSQFDFETPESTLGRMADLLKEPNADCEFRKIVKYMTGVDPASVWSASEKKKPGAEKCLCLLYRGENAIDKIRERLGATNPQKAEPGTVRSVYGYDLMQNQAHASDSTENAERERKIVGLWKEEKPCEFRQLIESYV